jgi:hypothetical protein
VLRHTPDAVGMNYMLWGSVVITESVKQKFGVNYAARNIRGLIRRIEFSSQNPIKIAYTWGFAKGKVLA